jgi:hypothetical protein
LTAGLWLALTIAASPDAGGGAAPARLVAKPRPTLTAAMFTQRWPVLDDDDVERPHRRQKLRRLVEITPDADADKARFLLRLGEAETAHWRVTARADRSWESAITAFTAAAAFPTFEQRDAALYWLTRLYLARVPDPSAR